jgi:RNA polymerase sigma factor (sigma-70 family)
MNASPSSEANRVVTDEAQAVSRALERLAEPDRELILLRHREHRTFEEIGQRLGCLTAEARRRWFQALERFADALERLP